MRSRRALVYLPALAILAIEAPVLWPVPYHLGDWFQFWFGGRIIATGGSPYDPAAWLPATTDYGTYAHGFVVNRFAGQADFMATPASLGLYPPWVDVAFVPFGILPLEAGVVLMHVTLLVAGVGAIAWTVARLALPDTSRALALAIGVALEPFALATRTGHITALLLLGALALWSALDRRSTPLFVLGAVLLTFKPHLALAFGVIVAAELVRRRAWRPLAVTPIVLAGMAAVFYLRYPLPSSLTLDAVRVQATIDDSATTWALAEMLAPGAGLLVGALAIATAVVIATAAWHWLGRSAAAVVALGLCISLAVAPYVHTYDDLLAVPALLMPISLSSGWPGPRRLAIGAATVFVAVLYPWFSYLNDVHARQAPTGAVPFLAIGLLALCAWGARSPGRA